MTASSHSPAPAWFVTGTDTEVGKTFVTCALLHAFAAQGLNAVGMKPIAAGTDADGCNEDVEQLLAAMPVKPARELVNPYLFAPPIAPHIAAAEAGRAIEPGPIRTAFDALRAHADAVLVEGVGGFLVPLGPRYDAADLAQDLALPVILVVGMRLGCINHALLHGGLLFRVVGDALGRGALWQGGSVVTVVSLLVFAASAAWCVVRA